MIKQLYRQPKTSKPAGSKISVCIIPIAVPSQNTDFNQHLCKLATQLAKHFEIAIPHEFSLDWSKSTLVSSHSITAYAASDTLLNYRSQPNIRQERTSSSIYQRNQLMIENVQGLIFISFGLDSPYKFLTSEIVGHKPVAVLGCAFTSQHIAHLQHLMSDSQLPIFDDSPTSLAQRLAKQIRASR